MFSTTTFRSIYDRILGPLSREITLEAWNGSTYDQHTVKAHVSRFDESELVSGGPVEFGDLRLIMLASEVPGTFTDPDQRDRFLIDGRPYSIVQWDPHERSIGPDQIAVEVAVRGG